MVLLRLYKCLLIIITIIVLTVGCSQDSNSDKIAYISANPHSQYEATFKDLNLGVLFDFKFKLYNADKSWVKLWVEAYKDGEKIETSPITQLTYGLNPNNIEEGSLGFGIINPLGDEPQVLLYSPGVRTNLQSIENILFKSDISGTWDYAIGNESTGLEYGEEKVLAVYRQFKHATKIYDYQDIDSINKMKEEDVMVLLFKIRIDKSNENGEQ